MRLPPTRIVYLVCCLTLLFLTLAPKAEAFLLVPATTKSSRPSLLLQWPALASTTTDATDVAHKAPQDEIDRRRNLAIISHPDSGKTTMTERLLLYGGAIQQGT